LNSQVDSGELRNGSNRAISGYGSSKLGESTSRRIRRMPLLVAILGLLLLLAAGSVAWVVNRSMQELSRESLRSILAANTTALEMWLTEVSLDAQRQLQKETINRAARNLLSEHAGQSDWSATDLESNADFEMLQQIGIGSSLGWALMDLDGNVAASNLRPLIGQILPIPNDAVQRLIEQNTTVCRPFKLPIALLNRTDHYSIPGGPMMCAMAPVTDDVRTRGSLSLLFDPLDRFTELLSVARTGQTGETYAFDRQGILLSQSRFETQLRSAGLLDSDKKIVSPLNIEVRDPGIDLTQGGFASLPRSRQPLTLMADQASRGATGDNVQGYNDYLGVPVVGAWRWLPEYGMGITTEMDVAEAHRPMNLLRRALYGLVILIVLSAIGFLTVALSYRRLTERLQSATSPQRRLGQYELGEVMGRGGMGTVYHGRHQLLCRDVAIKVLEGDIELSELMISRFEREVQLTAQLQHPNTIDIYDFGHTGTGTFFYVMEYVDGITLQELVDRYGRQDPPRVIHLLLQICGSLSEAHQLGMIHRDIKPSNILLTARAGLYDMIKVLDFGLVKRIGDGAVQTDSSSDLTTSDGITGTPMYMSPESVRDATTANEKSDLYSVGAVGYILLTGETLFDGDSSVDVCVQQLNDEPQRPCDRINQPLPEDLQNVLMSCLRKSPDERPMSADDLADSLRHCQDANRWTPADAIQWWEAGVN
jgi:serine/threonine-protein kinase